MSSRWSPAIDRLNEELRGLRFSEPVTHVYNPLVHAREAHDRYLELYGNGRKKVVFLGMNPGPWGMAQTGVPFGEIGHVRDWLQVRARVERPELEHPRRPILGFDCERSEVSGRRLWGWVKERWVRPERFFADHFVANYCPLVFMESSGRNRTPDKLPAEERRPLFDACDRALVELVDLLSPTLVVGVGKFAFERATSAVGDRVSVGNLLHPSPASPAANRGWAQAAEKQLVALGVIDPS